MPGFLDFVESCVQDIDTRYEKRLEMDGKMYMEPHGRWRQYTYLTERYFCLLTNQFCLQKNMVDFNSEFLYWSHVFTL